jgi:hypothetical protein
MKIKLSTIPTKRRYPYIGIGNQSCAVILFTESNTGFVLHSGLSGYDYKAGTYVTTAAEASFDMYTGQITLENE